MKRILLRAGKGPFDVISPERTLAENRLATNAGNLVFSHAAWKLLAAPGTEIVANEHRIDPSDAPRISDEFDVFVVPLANAIRTSFEPTLERLTTLIERLTIPVVIFGVGAQTRLDYDLDRVSHLDEAASRFARAVLAKSPTIGVRGELTGAYFKRLGFNDTDVIGCPSMFMYGDRLDVEKKLPELDWRARLAVNASPSKAAADTIGPIVASHYKNYPNLVYIAQNNTTLEPMLWGSPLEDLDKHCKKPIYDTHPLYREGKMRLFVDPWTWMSFLAERDFVFGTRIHGNIAGLLAGTPSFVLAHDSRTLEIARYFEIPHRKITDVPSDIDARDLYEEADYTAMNRGHRQRYATMVDFMAKHGLDCAFAVGGVEEFESRLQGVSFPPGVEPLSSENAKVRLRAVWDESVFLRRDLCQLRVQVDRLTSPATGVGPRLDRVERDAAYLKRNCATVRFRRALGKLLRIMGVRRGAASVSAAR